MKNAEMSRFANNSRELEELLSAQLRPKDEKVHVVLFTFLTQLYDLPENAFFYLQAQDREIADFKFAQLEGGGRQNHNDDFLQITFYMRPATFFSG